MTRLDEEGEPRRDRLRPEADTLRHVAEAYARASGLDLVLKGPYRWGAIGAPAVRGWYRHSDVDERYLVYFVGLPRNLFGLMSSTAVILDERGPVGVAITSTGDEG